MNDRTEETVTPKVSDAQRRRYEEAAAKGCQWLLGRLRADGSFDARNENLRCYLKSPLALLMAGAPAAAYRLLDTIKKRYLGPDGDLRTSSAVKYAADRFNQNGEKNYYLYGNGWAAISAHLNARHDISYPALEYLLRCQDARTGGFYSLRGGASGADQRQDAASTASCGYALLCCGQKSGALKAGEFFLRLLELQRESGRFYLSLRPEMGVVDRFEPGGAFFHVVDQGQEKQAYWILGYAGAVLAKLHLATQEEKYLQGAVRYFDFLAGCRPDFTSFFGCWKVAWAAALISSTLKDERYPRYAATILDHIVSAQDKEGYWFWGGPLGMGPDNDDWLFDLSSEMVLWLTEIPRILSSNIK